MDRRKSSLAAEPHRPLRLTVYHDGFGLGGMENSIGTLVGHLSPEIEIVVMGTDAETVGWIASHRPTAQAEVIRPVRNKWDVLGVAEHLRAIWRLRPDILQVHSAIPWMGKYSLLAGLLVPRVRVVMVDHTEVPPYNRMVLLMKMVFTRLVAAHVAVSHGLARFLEAATRARRGSIHVIHNGIEDLGALPRRRHEPAVIGTIARLTRQKGIDVLLHALQDIPEVQAVIVGDGEDRPKLEGLAGQLGVADRVTWEGWRDDARDLLQDFDLFVLSSRWEGFGRVLVEAELAKCPVVATRVIGTSEAMLDGETGLLVPPEDSSALALAIKVILADQNQASAMGERGRAYALQNFTPEIQARAYESLYSKIVGRPVVPASG